MGNFELVELRNEIDSHTLLRCLLIRVNCIISELMDACDVVTVRLESVYCLTSFNLVEKQSHSFLCFCRSLVEHRE